MIFFEDPAEFDAWLHENGAQETELWIKYAKKGSGLKTITYDEALDIALCHGWIDGLVRSIDDTYYSQRWTPRKARRRLSHAIRSPGGPSSGRNCVTATTAAA